MHILTAVHLSYTAVRIVPISPPPLLFTSLQRYLTLSYTAARIIVNLCTYFLQYITLAILIMYVLTALLYFMYIFTAVLLSYTAVRIIPILSPSPDRQTPAADIPTYLILPFAFDVSLRPFFRWSRNSFPLLPNGKARLWPLPASPDPLLDFVRGDTAQSRVFLAKIKRVNSVFSFTSTGSSLGVPLRQVGFARGAPAFVIQGAFHHYLSNPTSQAGLQPRYADIYFYSAKEEPLSYRLNNFEELNTSLLTGLMATVQGTLSRVNPYVGIYRSEIEIYRSSEVAARAAGRAPHAENMRIFLRTSNTPDLRRYNGSSAPMGVAAILPDSNEEALGGRDIVVHNSRRGLMRVSATHPSYEPLAYPILDPTGVSSWQGNIDLGPQPGSGAHAPLCPQLDRDAHGGVSDDHVHRDDGHDQPPARGGSARGSAKKVSQREFFAHRVADRARQMVKCTQFVHGRSRMTIDPRIPTMPGRSTSGLHPPGSHCLHQARSAARCSASCMKAELHPSKNRS